MFLCKMGVWRKLKTRTTRIKRRPTLFKWGSSRFWCFLRYTLRRALICGPNYPCDDLNHGILKYWNINTREHIVLQCVALCNVFPGIDVKAF